ncbi:pyridoxal-phosphate dependent enzyme, partial [bacterium]|nr:pyridoxal-phosphate dependent enzyme [bacterium]
SDVIELEDTLCPAPGAKEGAIATAMDIARDEPGFRMLNQYENEANPGAHYRTTGPEIWRQTAGRVTHFVASLGTCGTITGPGSFLKERSNGVRVIGVHPEEGHDIPGVRSLRQLQQTKLYRPELIDTHVEVTNREAYDMCLRLHREESLIGGPSSGLATVGALRAVPDEPGTVAVIMFPDDIFKYASSLQRHFPDLCPAPAGGGTARSEALVATLKAHANNPHDTIEPARLRERMGNGDAPLVLDVRSDEEYADLRVPQAVHAPLADLEAGGGDLPADPDTPIVTVCNVGETSLTAMLVLKARGYRRVRNLTGGLVAWMDDGLPTERG